MDEARTVTDSKGRKITLRQQDVMLTMDILEAAGVDGKGVSTTRFLQNERWMGFATLACYVQDIDGVPVPMPSNTVQIRALVGQLGNEGINAISESFRERTGGDENLEVAKN